MKNQARRKSTRNSQVDYSQFEKKELLAGDVQVSFVNGHLQVAGDDLANHVRLVVNDSGNIRISSSNSTFNGVSGPIQFDGPATKFTANLGDGNDLLYIENLTIAHDIMINGGLGNDIVRLRSTEARDININMGTGNDTIDIEGAKANKTAILRVSNGINVVAFNNLRTVQDLFLFGLGEAATTYLVSGKVQVGRDIFASYGVGHDRLMICGETEVGRNADFWLGPGHDIFAGVPERAGTNASIDFLLKVNGGSGNDLFCLDENFVVSNGGAQVAGGVGVNTLMDLLSQAQYSQIQKFTTNQPNLVFGVTMGLLEYRGIDYVKFGGAKLEVNPATFGITVRDASPTISSQWDRVAQAAVVIARSGPTVSARIYGMVHTAMYDAWSAYDLTAKSTLLGDQLQRPAAQNTAANKMKAMSHAAYRVLVDLLPAQKAMFDQLMVDLGYNPNDQSLNLATPTGVGNRMANRLLEFRHQDGSNQLGTDPNGTQGVRYSDTSGYQPVNQVGNLVDIQRWTPEHVPINNPAGPIQSYLTPHWGNVTPFAITSITDFRAPTPEPFLLVQGATVDYVAKTITLSDGTVLAIEKSLIGTVINPRFVQQFEEVVDLSANLTDQQKLIAEFWENGGGTSFPPGTWMGIGQYVSARDNHSIDQDAKLFFALGNAVMNAGIATWETKRAYDYTRPVRAIRELGNLGLIGEFDADLGGFAINAWVNGQGTQRILANQFNTYQPPGPASPPFPDYTSGHSSFSASAAEILRQFTGSDVFSAKVSFSPGSSRVQPGLVPSQKVTLAWGTFSEAASEAGMSRMYGGIHFRDANINGSTLGRQVGAATWEAVNRYFSGLA